MHRQNAHRSPWLSCGPIAEHAVRSTAARVGRLEEGLVVELLAAFRVVGAVPGVITGPLEVLHAASSTAPPMRAARPLQMGRPHSGCPLMFPISAATGRVCHAKVPEAQRSAIAPAPAVSRLSQSNRVFDGGPGIHLQTAGWSMT